MISNDHYDLFISQVVLSEYTFYLLIIEGGKAPLTLKRDKAIPPIIEQHNPADFLSKMISLETGPGIIPLYLSYMEKYNLLPNDALILATLATRLILNQPALARLYSLFNQSMN